MGLGIEGDFTGFKFGDNHSKNLGITRVSASDRYKDDLSPSFNDKTVTVAGSDETYYFSSNYSSKTFTLNIAFDNITETQLRKLKQVFGTKELKPLIFDELPFKYYMVKCQTPPQLKYICFDGIDETTNNAIRVYKGDGTLQFIAYYPFAQSRYQWLDESTDSNKDEWSAASGLIDEPNGWATIGTQVPIFNPGDFETDFYAYYFGSSIGANTIQVSDKSLSMDAITCYTDDAGIRINSRANLIEGVTSSGVPTGNIYNSAINSGDFFKIPIATTTTSYTFLSTVSCSNLEYKYLYY